MRELQALSPSFKGKIKEYSDIKIFDNVNEIKIPMTEVELPEDLREFIEKDQSFIPEIHSQKLKGIMIQNNTMESTDQRERLLTRKTLLKIENF